jgi:hypothetical protein
VNGSGAPAPDGRYRIEIEAVSGTEQVDRTVELVLDRTLGALGAAPQVLSPNGDRKHDRLRVGFELSRDATVRVRIRRHSKTLRTILAGSLTSGFYSTEWDGLDAQGRRVSDGKVNAVVHATTALGTRSLSVPLYVDTTRPAVRILSLRMRKGKARVRFALSENAEVHVWLGRKRWKDRSKVVIERKAGTRSYIRPVWANYVRLVAVDAGKNRSPVAKRRRD